MKVAGMSHLSNDLGIICESYTEVHALDILGKAYTQNRSGISGERLMLRTLLQCVELLHLNLIELSEKQQKTMVNGHLSCAFQCTLWHSSLLNLCNQLISYTLTLSSPIDSISNQTTIMRKYLNAYENLCKETTVFIKKTHSTKNNMLAVLFSSPLAGILHNMKIIFLRNESMICYYSILFIENKNLKETWLLEETLQCNKIKEAFNSLKLKGETYINQFRLLHQIPELLGMYCLETIEELKTLENSKESDYKLIEATIKITDLMQFIVLCTDILFSNLVPKEYHDFRRNLGLVSGTQSEVLAKKLFKSDYHWLVNKINDRLKCWGNKASFEYRTLLQREKQLRQSVLRWRDTHLGLPRNVIGGFGAKSIAGADAVQTVYHMRMASLSNENDQYKNAYKPSFTTDELSTSYKKKLDNLLLKITADVTKEKFPDTQQRTGDYSRAKTHK